MDVTIKRTSQSIKKVDLSLIKKRVLPAISGVIGSLAAIGVSMLFRNPISVQSIAASVSCGGCISLLINKAALLKSDYDKSIYQASESMKQKLQEALKSVEEKNNVIGKLEQKITDLESSFKATLKEKEEEKEELKDQVFKLEDLNKVQADQIDLLNLRTQCESTKKIRSRK